MGKIIFLIVGVLLGLCSFFSVRLWELNSGIEEMNYLLRKNMKATENELVALNRQCKIISSLVDDLTTDISMLKVNSLGIETKVGDKTYLKGGMYGDVRMIKANIGPTIEQLNDISKALNDVSMKLNIMKQSIGADYGITGINGKLAEINTKLDNIDYELTSIKLRLSR